MKNSELKLVHLDDSRLNAILNAALKEFALRGFDDASTNVIARDSDISKGLLFHYVNSKKDLFLFLYDYSLDMLDKEYFACLNFAQTDLLERLRQSYILQLDLLRRHPWIFEFCRLTGQPGSAEIQGDLEERKQERGAFCLDTLFAGIDETMFREGLDSAKCRQLIYWVNLGFTEGLLSEIRGADAARLDYDGLVERIDGFFTELRKVFYR